MAENGNPAPAVAAGHGADAVAKVDGALDTATAIVGQVFDDIFASVAALGEHSQTGLKKGRGMARASLDLIGKMYDIAAERQPITGRGIGYNMFTAGWTASMSTNEMQKVYRLLKIAREQGTIPWEWIVDETRELERVSAWDDPEQYARAVAQSYRRDFWNMQPHRLEVWSEKGTVRGVLKPVLDHYAVGFRVMHGFSGATTVHDIAKDDDGRPLIILYIGDFDPSGLFMSDVDLPRRIADYGGEHVRFERIALTRAHTVGLPSFEASSKAKDPRYRWFTERYGTRCWELDAMDPRALRECVERRIKSLIEPEAWARCEIVNAAELESLQTILSGWGDRHNG